MASPTLLPVAGTSTPQHAPAHHHAQGPTASCCPAPPRAEAGAVATVVLVGNPNVGKSTLFNVLTGASQTVGNWPGKTVHVAEGTWRPDGSSGTKLTVVDLPGTYSLVPASPDEELTRDLLAGSAERPDLAVVAVDCSNLARNLYLLSQVLDTGVPVVVALTMTDVAAARGSAVDAAAFARAVGVPAVVVRPRERVGTTELGTAVLLALAARSVPRPSDLGADVEAELAPLTAELGSRWAAVEALSGDDPAAAPARTRLVERAEAEQVDLDPELAGLLDAETLVAERRYAWAHAVLGQVQPGAAGHTTTWTDRIDRVLTSRWAGVPVFLAVMWAVFTATTRLAAPMQAGLQSLLDGPVHRGVVWALDTTHVTAPVLRGLVLDGLVSGVGQLLTFVPLMAVMFVVLALLEDSGYMARAAFVVDRLMRLVGLPGRAFLPLIVGFGCNVPALAGTRILPNARDRLLIGMLIPYVTCSARLTVYVLLANVFFGRAAGSVVFAMYLVSILLVVVMGLLLRRTLFRDTAREPLVLELPPYRRPTLRVIGRSSWVKVRGFLRTAGGVIVATVTAVWLLSSIPLAASAGSGLGSVSIEQSAFGRGSQALAPVFAPAGFGDWHAASALITGFVAKEAVVATQAQTYAAAEPTDMHQAGALGSQLRASFEASSGGHLTPAVLAFMVFLLAYTPCMATVAAQRAEIGMRLTLIGMGMQLAVAWGLAVAVFQLGRLVL
ncbi:ferrous iron transport protein B [Motilibacter rhizosphaerae]|uniref:Ferrous iron transport protein B n=1 Tax=Motilibacter rhizosphaerae TaxID=598652 RepID=A0A4Q7NB31_9ACTN|nr:ferrous iron transport protein B [Motilibacter rhizosphaerae]RZS80020.1 ferrous iron transport protein B [Motilibacter rhizosphaerae]